MYTNMKPEAGDQSTYAIQLFSLLIKYVLLETFSRRLLVRVRDIQIKKTFRGSLNTALFIGK